MYPVAEDYSETLYYPDPTIPVNTWLGHSSDFPALSYPNHWHSDFEFVYIVSGSMNENINGNVIELKEGDLLVICTSYSGRSLQSVNSFALSCILPL